MPTRTTCIREKSNESDQQLKEEASSKQKEKKKHPPHDGCHALQGDVLSDVGAAQPQRLSDPLPNTDDGPVPWIVDLTSVKPSSLSLVIDASLISSCICNRSCAGCVVVNYIDVLVGT